MTNASDPSSASATTVSSTINGEAVRHASCSIATLLADRDLTGKRVAIERNGAIVPRSRHADTYVEDGDRIEIVVAVGGG